MNQNNNKGWINHKVFGITILEAMIGLAALAAVALIVLPSATNMLKSYQVDKTANRLVEGLNLTRAEAANRGGIARMCPSSNGKTCRPEAGWDLGWIVFLDGNDDQQVQEFEFIRSFRGDESSVDIESVGAFEQIVSFNLSGLQNDNPDQQGEFLLCHREPGVEGKRIVVQTDGWIKSVALTTDYCVTPDDRTGP